MRQRYGAASALVQIRANTVHDVSQHLRMRTQGGVGVVVPDERGLEIGDAVEVHRPVLVVERDRLVVLGVPRDDVDACRTREFRLEPESRGRVMIAARHDDDRAGFPQLPQHRRQHGVIVGGRRRRVEDVPGDRDDIDPAVADDLHERLERHPQVVDGRVTVKGAPDVPVGGMQDLHARHGTRSR